MLRNVYQWLKFSWVHLHILLLPLFFVQHGWAEHFMIISGGEIVGLLLQYLLLAALLTLLFVFVFKSVYKAALAVFFLLSVHFFFGAFFDAVKGLGIPGLSRYSVLLPIVLVGYVLLLLLIKKFGDSERLNKFFTLLLLLLIAIDAAGITSQWLRYKPVSFELKAAANVRKPNVYLVLLDEYAGDQQLKTEFHFNNQAFLDSLRSLHFFVSANSHSNYNATPFSMASLLSMQYLDLKNYEYTDDNLNYCYDKIAHARVVKAFSSLGYQFSNFSIFDFEKKTALVNKTFLKSGAAIIQVKR